MRPGRGATVAEPSELRGAFQVPLSIFRGRYPDWALLDAHGERLTAEAVAEAAPEAEAFVAGTPTEHVIPFLTEHLHAVMSEDDIPTPHRAWALHRVLLYEMSALAAADYEHPAPPTLHAAIDEMIAESLRLAQGQRRADYGHHSMLSAHYALVMHQVDTAFYAFVLAGIAGISDREELRDIVLTGLFADAGLSRVPRAVLRLSGPLSEGQWQIVRRHPRHSANILLASGLATSGSVRAVLAHHERWDGRGYPLGVAGLEIPMPARIVAIADSYSAMTVQRPHQAAATSLDAMQGMIHATGQFETRFLRQFIELIGSHAIGLAA